MIELITSFLNYFFYALIAFVIIYWLLMKTFGEKKQSLKKSLRDFKRMKEANEHEIRNKYDKMKSKQSK